MEEKYYVVKFLTNTAGQDGSKIEGVYSDPSKAKVGYHNLLASLHNASDVLYAVVQIHDIYGNILGGTYREVVDHTTTPEPNEE